MKHSDFNCVLPGLICDFGKNREIGSTGNCDLQKIVIRIKDEFLGTNSMEILQFCHPLLEFEFRNPENAGNQWTDGVELDYGSDNE
jgi:hypothetical protein